MNDPIVFDATMEQLLQSAMIDFLDQQRVALIGWNRQQDEITAINMIAIVALAGTVFYLGYRVYKLGADK